MNRRTRSGVINLGDVSAYVGLILVALILFLLFLLVRSQAEGKQEDAEAPAAFAASRGSLLFATYLRTPLDAEPALYGSTAKIPGQDVPMSHGIALALADTTCASWLAENGRYGEKDPFSLSAPSAECAAVFLRTVLFFRAACGDRYLVELTQGETSVTIRGTGLDGLIKERKVVGDTFGSLVPSEEQNVLAGRVPSRLKSPSISVLGGSQAIPAEPPIRVRGLCVEKHGVIRS